MLITVYIFISLGVAAREANTSQFGLSAFVPALLFWPPVAAFFVGVKISEFITPEKQP